MNLRTVRTHVDLQLADSRGTVTLTADWPGRPDNMGPIEISITLPLGSKAHHVSLRDTRRLLEETARATVAQPALQRWVEAQTAERL
jgi:hypothetical protein